ncbi:MAG: DUF4349 domain-containing protein [Defluviitaleaceae bacterium]|nr:DUF4349 domain-containing protein [Defluviitaleaceae bacterium]
MRKAVVCLLAVVFILLYCTRISAQDRQLRHHHSIEIEVECLDIATDIIMGLNGYNLESSVFLHEADRRHFGSQRSAFFMRRVDYWAFGHVQEALRGLGEVHFETENAQFLGAQIVDAEARIVALTQEIERLSIMMAASDSLDVLIAIDARLSQVTLERNSVIGTMNVLMTQAANPVITISIHETLGERPRAVPPGFGSRITDSFMGSLRATGDVIGNFLVFFARAIIPLLIYVALALLAIWVCFRVKRKRASKQVLAAAGTGHKSTAATWVDTLETVDEAEADICAEPAKADDEGGMS